MVKMVRAVFYIRSGMGDDEGKSMVVTTVMMLTIIIRWLKQL